MRNGLEIDIFNNKFWYKNGKLHKEDGPAVKWNDGVNYWCKEGKVHRLDGPAVEWNTEYEKFNNWYYEGERINCSSQKEFLQIIKLRVFK